MKLVNFLKGYKTYIVAFVTVVYGILNHSQNLNAVVPYLFSGLGLAALRAAVAKAEAAVARVEAKLPASVQKVVDPVVNAAEKAVDSGVDAQAAKASK